MSNELNAQNLARARVGLPKIEKQKTYRDYLKNKVETDADYNNEWNRNRVGMGAKSNRGRKKSSKRDAESLDIL